MEVRELNCPACDVQVRGHFGSLDRYQQLTPEQAAFLETFLRCRGVLRDVEAALGISYPTVRARLDQMLGALGFTDATHASTPNIPTPPAPPAAPGKSEDSAAKRRDILAALDTGALDAAAALEALKNLK